MIFKLGPLPELPEFTPDDSWTLLREPSFRGFQLRAIPIALVTTLLLGGFWILLTPAWQVIRSQTFPLPVLTFVVCLLGVLAVHELIHISVHPQIGISEKSVMGFWPSRMFLYTIYVGEHTRNRCLTILIMPFLIISIVPLGYAAVTQTAPFWLVYISILNALLASGDLQAAYITIRCLPKGATIRAKGWATYWKTRR